MTEIYDKACVRLVEASTEMCTQAYYSNNLSETLKFYDFAKEKRIPITVSDNPNTYFIDDIDIQFGGGEGLLSINIYVD